MYAVPVSANEKPLEHAIGTRHCPELLRENFLQLKVSSYAMFGMLKKRPNDPAEQRTFHMRRYEIDSIAGRIRSIILTHLSSESNGPSEVRTPISRLTKVNVA